MHGCDGMANDPEIPSNLISKHLFFKIFSQGYSPKHYHVNHADLHNDDHPNFSIQADLQLIGLTTEKLLPTAQEKYNLLCAWNTGYLKSSHK